MAGNEAERFGIAPEIPLPTQENESWGEFCQDAGHYLGMSGRVYQSGGVPVEPDLDHKKMRIVTPASLSSLTHGVLVCVERDDDGRRVIVMLPLHLSAALLQAPWFFEQLPKVEMTLPGRSWVRRDRGGKVEYELLPPGYDKESRIYVFEDVDFLNLES